MNLSKISEIVFCFGPKTEWKHCIMFTLPLFLKTRYAAMYPTLRSQMLAGLLFQLAWPDHCGQIHIVSYLSEQICRTGNNLPFPFVGMIILDPSMLIHWTSCWKHAKIPRQKSVSTEFLTCTRKRCVSKRRCLVAFRPSQFKNQRFPLSLIHIWRCRRSTLCRSRWSPYH